MNFSWLCFYAYLVHIFSSVFCVLKLYVFSGERLDFDEDNFSLFETQCYTPEVISIGEEDTVKVQSKAQKAIARLHPMVQTRKSIKDPSSVGKGTATVVPVEDSDSDFVSDAPWKRGIKHVSKDAHVSTADSSDDFITQKPRKPIAKNIVTGNKRPTKAVKKSRPEVPKLVPYKFPHLSKAKQLKQLILSIEYLSVHGE